MYASQKIVQLFTCFLLSAFTVCAASFGLFAQETMNKTADPHSALVSVQVRSRAPLSDNSTFGGPCQFVGFAPNDYWIRYKTVEFASENVTFYCSQLDRAAFAERGRSLERKLVEIAAGKTERSGGSDQLVLLFGYFDSPNDLKNRIAALQSEAKTVVLVRDLVEIQLPQRNQAPQYDYRESIVREFEREQNHKMSIYCASTVSTNFLPGPAYRFPEDKRSHLAVLVSDDHYHADKTWPLFAELLEKDYGIYTTFLHGEMSGKYRGWDELDVCGALVVFQRREAIPEELAKKMTRLWSNPQQGFLGMRTASHAFETRKEELAGWTTISKDKMVEIIGGNYNNHGPNAPGSDIVNVDPENAPELCTNAAEIDVRRELAKRLLNQVQPARWHSGGSQYFTSPLAPDSVLLQEAVLDNRAEPLTWVRLPASDHARIAFTCLGYPSDFNEPACRQMLTNLILWILP